jgi:3-oxoacyl-[acyl-carrier protein] reductase|tara:strand:+ start:2451 stop:3170 length:720 start_codon:yes stop_codon:yes gene_type:complete
LNKKRILVVGGSSGIGRGIANCFLNLNADVCITGTKKNIEDYGLEDVVSQKSEYVQLDLLDPEALGNLVIPFDSLDVLVCSQGTVQYKRKEFEMEIFREVLDLNLTSMMACCQKFKPLMTNIDTNIILLGSGASYKAVRGNPAYSASKGGILTLVKTLAEAWAREGIRVNGIAPGYVASKLTEVTFKDKNRYESSLKNIPLARWGEAEDIGHTACFLASSKASYITGQMITVDGGLGLS